MIELIINMDDIKLSVINMLKVNMNLKDKESILIVSDIPKPEEWQLPYNKICEFATRSLMARKVYDIVRENFIENRVDYIVYDSLGQNGVEPPEEVAEKLKNYDVILMINTYSLSHTNAREKASKAGARIASMPGLEYEMLKEDGALAADYYAIKKETEQLANLLTKAKRARVVTDNGTDIEFSIEGRYGGADTGIIANKGEWGNLPGGEAFIAPVEGTATGRLVVPAGWYFDLNEDMILDFKNGYVVSIHGGGKVGEELRNLCRFGDDRYLHRRNCAELGIGTNPKAKRPDNVLEAEKIKGTIHIAIGDSSHIGGNNESDLHEDFVIPMPTLYLDEEIVIEKGEILKNNV